MKKKIVALIFIIFGLIYAALSLMLTKNKNDVFWIGFSFLIFSLIITFVLTIISIKKKSAAFPVEISSISFSSLYIVTVLFVNLVFGNVFKLNYKVVLSIHIVCLAIFIIFSLLILLAKTNIIKQNLNVSGKICELQILTYDFEKIKGKLTELPETSRKNAIHMVEKLLDELKYSNFSSFVDAEDIDNKIRKKALSLTIEVNNLIEIQADDLSSFEISINEISQLIKDRNMQIKLLSNKI